MNIESRIHTLLESFYHPGLKSIDLSLGRMQRFMALLGSPQRALPPVIHIAGTNGKGSLVANLQSIFTLSGYSVHRYISPHLVRFNERITIAGQEIGNEELLALLEEIAAHIKRQPVTFFEATTAAAMLAFSRHPADVILLEVGMGGRFDATNVIENPALTAITPINFDHCDFLGDTLAKIAAEKAGIIKPGVPCVVGRQLPEAMLVITKQASDLASPLWALGQDFSYTRNAKMARYRSRDMEIDFCPALQGDFQYDNAATAIACIEQMKGFSISREQMARGIAQMRWPGRLQPLTHGPLRELLPAGMELWLDGGHNPQGGEMLAQWLASKKPAEIYLVCGMVKGKDSAGFLRPMAPLAKALYAIAIPEESTSQSAQAIADAASGAGMQAQLVDTLEKALQTIGLRAKTPAVIVICGSLYLAGKVLAVGNR